VRHSDTLRPSPITAPPYYALPLRCGASRLCLVTERSRRCRTALRSTRAHVFRTLIEQSEIVDRRRVARGEPERRVELRPSLPQIPAQHIRISLIIEDIRCVTHQFRRGHIAAVGEIESSQSIVARRQSDPGGRVSGGLFDGALKVLLGQAKIAFVETLDAQFQRLVRGIVLHIARILSCDGVRDRCGSQGR